MKKLATKKSRVGARANASRRASSKKRPGLVRDRGKPRDDGDDRVLWEDDLYAITQEGLAAKGTTWFLPKRSFRYWRGACANTLPKFELRPLFRALDRAIRIHFPGDPLIRDVAKKRRLAGRRPY
jgi:hypothetical protein